MKQMIRSLLSAATFVATLGALALPGSLASLAWAQPGSGAPAGPPTSEDELAPDPAATSTPEGPAGEVPFDPSTQPPPPEANVAKWSRWSRRFIDRPRTLPAGMIEVGGYLDFERVALDGDSLTFTSLLAGGGYGVSDKLEVRASYGLTLDEFEAKGPLAVGAGFGLIEGTLALAASADFVYDLASKDGELGLGARVRGKLTPDLALYTSRQLVMRLVSDAGKPANLRLPLGVGFQLSEPLYLFAETELAVLNLKDSETQALFSDYIPLTLGGVFTLSTRLEVGGLVYTDLKTDAFESLFLEVFGRIYL